MSDSLDDSSFRLSQQIAMKKVHLDHELYLQVTQRCIISPLDLFQFVVIAYLEQSSLNVVHLLNFTHDIFINSVHYFLQSIKKQGKLPHRIDWHV